MAVLPEPRPRGDSIGAGPEHDGDDDRVRAYLRYTGVGLQFFVIFLGLVLGGVYLDKRFSSAPWLTLAGTALGGTAAFYTLYKAVYGIDRRRGASPKAKAEAREKAPGDDSSS
jgi:hypothetical protein